MKKIVLSALVVLLLQSGELVAQSKIIQTEKAPVPIGPYSQGVAANGLLFVAGQIGLEPVSRKLVAGGVEKEIAQIMENIKAILTAAGLDLTRVVNTTIYIKDIGQFGKVNEVYGRYFTGQYPARTTVGVADLPGGAAVEIAVIAAFPR
ncbi:Rid family detoxifying hydrolase [Telluribacter sp.]|jgi:2-iminobutanoate/2-iminopropanoate deaminase|uniref:Rid family detoxifying hydrolase n=1 Tax=Telluribacter sp. TaxID=1978767 RepID=UPI002E0F2C89|nr:Rid family detoxifying hydrolase [Telluribacter sp.]